MLPCCPGAHHCAACAAAAPLKAVAGVGRGRAAAAAAGGWGGGVRSRRSSKKGREARGMGLQQMGARQKEGRGDTLVIAKERKGGGNSSSTFEMHSTDGRGRRWTRAGSSRGFVVRATAAAPLRSGAGGRRGWAVAAAGGCWREVLSGAGESARWGRMSVGWAAAK